MILLDRNRTTADHEKNLMEVTESRRTTKERHKGEAQKISSSRSINSLNLEDYSYISQSSAYHGNFNRSQRNESIRIMVHQRQSRFAPPYVHDPEPDRTASNGYARPLGAALDSMICAGLWDLKVERKFSSFLGCSPRDARYFLVSL